MAFSKRDADVLTHILYYCEEIETAVARFGNTFEDYAKDSMYRNATAMCILQIGELAGVLSEKFKKDHADVPWREIKDMRNMAAHAYGKMSAEILWETITMDIPELKTYCKNLIHNE